MGDQYLFGKFTFPASGKRYCPLDGIVAGSTDFAAYIVAMPKSGSLTKLRVDFVDAAPTGGSVVVYVYKLPQGGSVQDTPLSVHLSGSERTKSSEVAIPVIEDEYYGIAIVSSGSSATTVLTSLVLSTS